MFILHRYQLVSVVPGEVGSAIFAIVFRAYVLLSLESILPWITWISARERETERERENEKRGSSREIDVQTAAGEIGRSNDWNRM